MIGEEISDNYKMFSSADRYNNIFLQISCLLSILGSSLVMLISNTKPILMKQQKGKYLIFWLSFSDLMTSVIYLLSSLLLTHHDYDYNSYKCQIFALLGIFFPVASFLWTDFIAYYLYSMIVTRKLKTDQEWKILMIYFHIISWGVSALCIFIVALFGHAGSSGQEEGDNTGGWCWVTASSKSLILWEIIGGKFVEWLSAFIILPYFYFITACTLMSLDHSWSQMTQRNKKNSKKGTIWDTISNTTLSIRYSLQTYFYSETATSDHPLLGSSDDEDDELSEGDDSVSFDLSEEKHPSLSFNQQTNKEVDSHSHERNDEPTDDESQTTPKFRKFYAKMALVPILFFLARIWGSIRILIYATCDDDNLATHSANTWLKTMQAIFDTSQGFLNAILFVFLSTENMSFLYDYFYLSRFFEIIGCDGCCHGRKKETERKVEGWSQQNLIVSSEKGGRNCYSPSKSNEDENGSSSYLPQLNTLRTNYFDDPEDEEEEVNDDEKVIWDPYKKTNDGQNTTANRSIKCSFTEDNGCDSVSGSEL